MLDHLGPFGTLFDHYGPFIFSGRFDTSGSKLPPLAPEIFPLYAFCDVVVVGVGVVGVVVGIGDSRSWIIILIILKINVLRNSL